MLFPIGQGKLQRKLTAILSQAMKIRSFSNDSVTPVGIKTLYPFEMPLPVALGINAVNGMPSASSSL